MAEIRSEVNVIQGLEVITIDSQKPEVTILAVGTVDSSGGNFWKLSGNSILSGTPVISGNVPLQFTGINNFDITTSNFGGSGDLVFNLAGNHNITANSIEYTTSDIGSNGFSVTGGIIELTSGSSKDISLISNGKLTLNSNFGNITTSVIEFSINSISGVPLNIDSGDAITISSDGAILMNSNNDLSLISGGDLVLVPGIPSGFLVFTLGSDAKGDLYYRDNSGHVTRLPIGASGQVLTVSGAGLPVWNTSSIGDGDKGDITISGSGSTWTIDNDVVTFAKMQNIATQRLLGRSTAGSGDVEQISIGAGLLLSGGSLSNTVGAAGSHTQIQFNNAGSFGASSNLTWTGTQLQTSSILTGDITISNLTSGRVPFASTGGSLIDDSGLQFNGTTNILNIDPTGPGGVQVGTTIFREDGVSGNGITITGNAGTATLTGNAFLVSAATASQIIVGANLAISTTSGGDIGITSADDLSLSGTDQLSAICGGNMSIRTTGGGDLSIQTTGGSGNININSVDSVSVTAGIDITLNPTGDIYLTAGSEIITSGTLTGVITNGTYTPTLTNTANISASTAHVCQYLRVGNVVTVSGGADIDPTIAATITSLGISLPIASNFSALEQCGGTSCGSYEAPGQIVADAVNNRATMEFLSASVTNNYYSFTFTYRII